MSAEKIDERIERVKEKVDKITTVKGKENDTPQYIIKSKDIFSSDIKGMEEDSAPCLWAETGSERNASYDSSGKLTGDGKVIGKDPVVCMKYGSWGPLLQDSMFNGKPIAKIGIHRLAILNEKQVVVQELNYETCLIKTYEQSGDKITFSFCYIRVEDLSIAYDNSGKKVGQTGMLFDYGNLSAKKV